MIKQMAKQAHLIIFLILLAGFFTIWVKNTAAYPFQAKVYNKIELTNPARMGEVRVEGTNISGQYLQVIVSPEQQTLIKGGNSKFTVIILNTSNNVDLVDVSVNSPLVPDCNKAIGNLAADSNFPPYSCTLRNVQGPFTNELTAQGKNPINDQVDVASATGTIDLLDLEVRIIPDPVSLPEPGGNISFTLSLSNTGTVETTLTELTSLQFGDLIDETNPAVFNNNCPLDLDPPLLPVNDEGMTCSFAGTITGQPGDIQVSVAASGGKDTYGNLLNKSGQTMVQITNVPAAISVTLSANLATVSAPGGTVNFKAFVENRSSVDSIVIENLTDTSLGDLNNKGTCQTPQELEKGDTYECEYEHFVSGEKGEVKTFTLTATGIDDDQPAGPVSGFDKAMVEIIQPQIHTVFFPLIFHLVEEPNNTCSQVFPITINRAYFFMANDTFDLYRFDLQDSGDVTVSLTNFLPKKGQLIVYQDTGEGCENSEVLKNNANEEEQKILQMGTLQIGRYYVLVLNEGAPNTTDPYRLEVIMQQP